MKKKIVYSIVALFLLIQFIRIDTTNPPVDQEKDFLVITSAPQEVSSIINTSCYDCHSNTTEYPWYAQIAPVSWWIKHHVDDGRDYFNFSEWANYSEERADHLLEECVEYVEDEEMPLSSYTLMHDEAELTEDQRNVLIDFFNSLRTGISEEH